MGSDEINIKKMLQSQNAETSFRHHIRGSSQYNMMFKEGENRVVGVVKPDKWLFQLSYILKIPLHSSFHASPLDKIYCLTMSAEHYNRMIGSH
jgi:hypothetical protein